MDDVSHAFHANHHVPSVMIWVIAKQYTPLISCHRQTGHWGRSSITETGMVSWDQSKEKDRVNMLSQFSSDLPWDPNSHESASYKENKQAWKVISSGYSANHNS